ncbi:hypothetical protein [Streptomyces aquilus]|uniref:hypothetical protein n=1 Tax=Streptomyces aquilus TaxID=2548456 RepID=UPI001AD80363|nr:hypothetical protein [Streptomyces aquilus]
MGSTWYGFGNDYFEAKVGVATSSTPCGPYNYRGSFRPLGNVSRDLGLNQETDGTGYLLTGDRNNGGLRIDKPSATTSRWTARSRSWAAAASSPRPW